MNIDPSTADRLRKRARTILRQKPEADVGTVARRTIVDVLRARVPASIGRSDLESTATYHRVLVIVAAEKARMLEMEIDRIKKLGRRSRAEQVAMIGA